MKNRSLRLILASSSAYRRELLSRLVKSFDQSYPDIDESIFKNETVEAYVMRLARQKAEAVAATGKQGIILASDQSAETADGIILNKPGSFEQAFSQLSSCSGQSVVFITGIALLNTQNGYLDQQIDRVRVKFRTLTEEEIKHYLLREEPYDCAGSFKCEGLGIALFESIESTDPNSLIGLPLIRLNQMLLKQGINPLLLES